MALYKICGPSKTPVKYTSADTRFASLHGFMGGAEGDQSFEPPEALPIDSGENLEQRFKSGANRTDCPSQYGPPAVHYKLGNEDLNTADNLFGWRRRKGDVLPDK